VAHDAATLSEARDIRCPRESGWWHRAPADAAAFPTVE
jgi:hypothetical protein